MKLPGSTGINGRCPRAVPGSGRQRGTPQCHRVEEVKDQIPDHHSAEKDDDNPSDHLGSGQQILDCMTQLLLSGMRHLNRQSSLGL